MSECKFTKGPWKVTGTGDVSVDIPAPYYESIGVGVNECAPFCIVISRRNIASRLEANANLIAAAPELYEALENQLKNWIELIESGDAGFWNPDDDEHVIAMRKVLAKARGEKNE